MKITHIADTPEARTSAPGTVDTIVTAVHTFLCTDQHGPRLAAARPMLVERVQSAPRGATVLIEGIAHVPEFRVPADQVEADVRTLLAGRDDLDVYLVTG